MILFSYFPFSAAYAFGATSNATFKVLVSSDAHPTGGSSVTVNKGDKVYADIYISNMTHPTDTTGINYGLYKMQYNGDNFSIGSTEGTDYIIGSDVSSITGWGCFDFLKTGSGATSTVECKVGDTNYDVNVLITATNTEYYVLRFVFTALESATVGSYDFSFFTYVDLETPFTQTGTYDGNLFMLDSSSPACNFLATATNASVNIQSGATVNAATPVITNSLASPSTNVGTAVTALNATATVSDGGTISYAWYSNTTASTTGGSTLGVTTPTYAPPVGTAGTYYYYCVVTNTNNAASGTKIVTATSNISTVTVNAVATGVTATLSADKTTVLPGETVTITERLNGTNYLLDIDGQEISTFTTVIGYNSTIFTPATAPTAGSENTLTDQVDENANFSPGYVYYSGYSDMNPMDNTSGGPDNAIDMINWQFTVGAGVAPGTYRFFLSPSYSPGGDPDGLPDLFEHLRT